jgi:Skp family chaperone for outer membrane proteins
MSRKGGRNTGSMFRKLARWTLSAALIAAIIAPGAQAQAAAIGKVDIEKINKEYKLATRYQDELQRYRTELEKQFEDFVQTAYLSADELAELNQLKGKKSPTPAEQARIKELGDYTKAQRDRLRTLEQKSESDLTDPEKAEMAQLRQKETDAQRNAQTKDSDLMQQLVAKQQQYADEIEKNVTAALGEVCQAKNLVAVFGSDVLLYGGVDITEDVLAKLNVD